MPFFDLKTNVKEVPAEFHKETTDLIANLLGKPSSVSVTCVPSIRIDFNEVFNCNNFNLAVCCVDYMPIYHKKCRQLK